MSIRSHLLTLLAIPALSLAIGGCGNTVSKSDFKNTLMKDVKLSEPVANCVTEELFRKLDETQLEHVYVGERAKLTATEREAVDNAAVLCVGGGPKKTTGTGTTKRK